MASVLFQKRDISRLKKVYPSIRRIPRYELTSNKEADILATTIDVDDTDGNVTCNFDHIFADVPTVTAGIISGTSVALTITNITTSSVDISWTGPFNGSLNIHAIYIPS